VGSGPFDSARLKRSLHDLYPEKCDRLVGKASEKLFNFKVLNQSMSTDAMNAELLKKASLPRGQACGQLREAIDVSLYPQFFNGLAQLLQQVYHLHN